MPVYWGALVFIILGGLGCMAGYRKQGVYVVIAGIVACVWGWHWSSHLIDPDCYRRDVSLTGFVTSLPVRYKHASGQGLQSFRLSVGRDGLEDCGRPGSLTVYGVNADQVIPIGAEVALRGRLNPSSSQWNLGSVPDQARWLAQVFMDA